MRASGGGRRAPPAPRALWSHAILRPSAARDQGAAVGPDWGTGERGERGRGAGGGGRGGGGGGGGASRWRWGRVEPGREARQRPRGRGGRGSCARRPGPGWWR